MQNEVGYLQELTGEYYDSCTGGQIQIDEFSSDEESKQEDYALPHL